MYSKFQTSPKSGGNSGSCASTVKYLEKEDKDREQDDDKKGFFSQDKDNLSGKEAVSIVEHDGYKQKLGKDDSKFFVVTMAFSQDELKGRTDKELMNFAKENFAEMYAGSVKGREVDPSTLAWVGKLETERKYRGDDENVKQGLAKSGQAKEGDQRHVHIIVARKTTDGKKISPMSNHFRGGSDSGAVRGGFDQAHFKIESEQRFDKAFKHDRDQEQSAKAKLSVYRDDLREPEFKKELKNAKLQTDKQRLNELSNKMQQFKKALQSNLKEAKEMVNKFSKFIAKKLGVKIKEMEKNKEKENEIDPRKFLKDQDEKEKENQIDAQKFINREEQTHHQKEEDRQDKKEKDKGLGL